MDDEMEGITTSLDSGHEPSNGGDQVDQVSAAHAYPRGKPRLLISRAAELRQLRRYFPGAPASDFCIWCTQVGHVANHCPQHRCHHCKSFEHSTFRCPTRKRCHKCRRLGHEASACTGPGPEGDEAEAQECAFCCSQDHLEDACDEFWRSARPGPEAIKKVKSLPTSCYRCGSGEHFGEDCGKDTTTLQSDPTAGGQSRLKTWSIANRDQFIDPQSENVSIAAASAVQPPPSPPQPDFGGRSIVPRVHIFFDESGDDDDGEAFIKPAVAEVQPTPKMARVTINTRSVVSGGVQEPQQQEQQEQQPPQEQSSDQQSQQQTTSPSNPKSETAKRTRPRQKKADRKTAPTPPSKDQEQQGDDGPPPGSGDLSQQKSGRRGRGNAPPTGSRGRSSRGGRGGGGGGRGARGSARGGRAKRAGAGRGS